MAYRQPVLGFCIGILFGLVSGCEPLERPKIPVVPGIRIDSYVEIDQARADLDKLAGLGFSNLTIELTVMADTATGFPKINRSSLTQLSRYLPLIRERGWGWNLVLAHENGKPLFFENTPIADTGLWFGRYRSELLELRGRFAEYPPTLWFVGDDFEPLENLTDEWGLLFATLRDSLGTESGIRLGYCAAADRADQLVIWQHTDIIGLHYRITPLSHSRTYARSRHEIIGNLAIRTGKPVFICQSQLVEKDKLLPLKNKFRFWPESVKIEGITINSIYPVSAFSDTLTYYGIGNRPEVLDWLNSYRK
jgi:hypothetical protein